MKIKINIVISLLSLCLISANVSYSQIKAVNDKGEKIIVYPDGRWEYDTEGQKPATTSTNGKSTTTANTPNESGEKEYSNAEMLAARGELLNKYKSLKAQIQGFENEVQKHHSELSNIINSNQGNMDNADKKAYETKLKILQRKIKTANKSAKQKRKEEERLQKILILEGPEMMTHYEKIKAQEAKEIAAREEKKRKEAQAAMDKAKAEYEKELAKIRAEKNEEFEKRMKTVRVRSPHLLKYRRATAFKAPKPRCELAFDEVDTFTGKRKRATKSRRLFSYVDPAYEAALKGKGYIECDGFLSEINNGRELLLVLDFKVKNKTAFEEFGGLTKGGELTFKLFDGSMINLKNKQTDTGKVNANDKYTIFRGYFSISKSNARKLGSSEVSIARVFWGNGYEDYEVYHMDFFREQIRCLKEVQ